MLDERYKIDELAAQAGGYFALPTEENMAYTELCLISASSLAFAIIPQQKRNATSLKK